MAGQHRNGRREQFAPVGDDCEGQRDSWTGNRELVRGFICRAIRSVRVVTNQRVKHTEDASLEGHRRQVAVPDGRDDGGAEENRLDDAPLLLRHRHRELQLGVQQQPTLRCVLDGLLVLGQLDREQLLQVGCCPGIIYNRLEEIVTLPAHR